MLTVPEPYCFIGGAFPILMLQTIMVWSDAPVVVAPDDGVKCWFSIQTAAGYTLAA